MNLALLAFLIAAALVFMFALGWHLGRLHGETAEAVRQLREQAARWLRAYDG